MSDFTSAAPAVPAVNASHTGTTGGDAVYGHSDNGRGVVATSKSNFGLRALSESGVGLRSTSSAGRGVEGSSTDAEGIVGDSHNNTGVHGLSASGVGVKGTSDTHFGMRAHSKTGVGLRSSSDAGRGLEASSANADAIVGDSQTGSGVHGVSANGSGVWGASHNGAGVRGESVNDNGVHATTNSSTAVALAAYQLNKLSPKPAIHAKHWDPNGAAAVFEGHVSITRNLVVDGDITLTNADCAEDFDISCGSSSEPGTVMVLDDESRLNVSTQSYDKRVAGVISGAGSLKPGLVLDRQELRGNRKPIALLGKVFCNVDATFGPIAVGDLLTTSSTPGHAMRVGDPVKAFGAVIGKALRPLAEGRGMIPILIALQ